MHTPFYKTWWFKLLAIGAVAVGAYYASYLPGYYRWYKAMEPYREQNEQLAEYYEYLDEQASQKEALYKADTYGGDTPEQTLELFITALEAEDYELASKYYIPEVQQKAKDGFEKMQHPEIYISILKGFEQRGSLFANGQEYEVQFYENGVQKHVERFLLNSYTQKWKLEEF